MKRLTFIAVALAAVFAGQSLYAQGSKYGHGADSAECIKYLSYYQEYYKQKNYDSALPNWRKAYAVCPATASQNMFIHGTTLMTKLYGKTQDAAAREAIVDTILTLQDQRMATYPKKKVDILNNKGQYMINYRGANASYLYNNLSPIVTELAEKSNGPLLVNLLQSAITLYRENQVSADDVIALYEQVNGYAQNAVAKNDKEAEENAKAKVTIESIFADSKVASCENLIAIFSPRFEANKEDKAFLTNVVRLMNSAEDCSSNDLYYNAVTTLHRLDPAYTSAYGLYRLNVARGNVADAAKYLEEAIAYEESDAATDAKYCFELTNLYYKNGMRARAYEAARKTVEMDNGYAGKAYMIMGHLWASASCDGEVNKYARYWAATDFYQKARSADPSLSDEVSSSIGSISRYYPEASEIFMYDLGAGQSYTVSCGGMTASTTVRVSR